VKRQYTDEEIQLLHNIVWRQIKPKMPDGLKQFEAGKATLRQLLMWARIDSSPLDEDN
jgi:hypothetical protein